MLNATCGVRVKRLNVMRQGIHQEWWWGAPRILGQIFESIGRVCIVQRSGYMASGYPAPCAPVRESLE